MTITKTCSKCKIEKPVLEFYKWNNNGNGYYPSCKSCKDSVRKIHRLKFPEKHLENSRRHYIKNSKKIIKKTTEYAKLHPEIRRKILLKHQYGISEEFYKTMEISQGGKCAICFTTPENHKLFVDHCHSTKKIRGLLCRKCNAVLGMCDDNISVLENSITYLRRTTYGLE